MMQADGVFVLKKSAVTVPLRLFHAWILQVKLFNLLIINDIKYLAHTVLINRQATDKTSEVRCGQQHFTLQNVQR